LLNTGVLIHMYLAHGENKGIKYSRRRVEIVCLYEVI
jgi:hypothetical protein